MSTDPAPDDVALTVACPRCAAAPGELCRTADRLPRAPHRRRTAAYLDKLAADH
ncbi:zinc finger domain-containing protein [Cellulomonas sp. ICMP 17802]|uniref:zinc finger domain-containing protein n=1 Tax=Cellulomonas sp. ICMP 17802 TaxID=3239199 RepID=UPI00351B0637